MSIDTKTYKPGQSRWEDVFVHLQDSGFDVYSPGTKVGECTSEYLVVKLEGSSRHVGISTDDDFYAILCYVPKQKYSALEPLIQRVKKAMKGLEPMILPSGSQTPSYYDDDFKAHMVSIQYKNYKKML